MKSGCPILCIVTGVLATLAWPSAVSAAELCAGKTPPVASACYTVGKCDPATGEFVLVDRKPSKPAPACKKYTGGCDATTGAFSVADVICPTGQECSPSTGRCAAIDRCKDWVAPTDANKCNTHTCNPTTGATRTSVKTCDAGQFCGAITGQCNPICMDSDPKNEEGVLGQLTLKGEISSSDRCTSDSKLEQVGCDAGGSAKVYTARACAEGTCKNGVCVNLCTKVPSNDRCTTFSCDPISGTVARAQIPPPPVNACQIVGACDATTGYTIASKPPPLPVDVCRTVGTCDIRTGEFAQNALTCPSGQECNVLAGGCVALNKCKNWTSPADRCNTYTCDPPTGDVTKLPIQPPTITACQTVKACDSATGFTVVDTPCPAETGATPPATAETTPQASGTAPTNSVMAQIAKRFTPIESVTPGTTANTDTVDTPPPVTTTTTSTLAIAEQTVETTLPPAPAEVSPSATAPSETMTTIVSTPSTPTIAEKTVAPPPAPAPAEASPSTEAQPETTATLVTPPPVTTITTTSTLAIAEKTVAPPPAPAPAEATPSATAQPETPATIVTPPSVPTTTSTSTIAEKTVAPPPAPAPAEASLSTEAQPETTTTIVTPPSVPTITATPTIAEKTVAPPPAPAPAEVSPSATAQSETTTTIVTPPAVTTTTSTSTIAERATSTSETASPATTPPVTEQSTPQTTEDRPTTDDTECPLRARRICALKNAQPTSVSDILLVSDIDIREAITEDRKNTITSDDPAVQQTLALVGENFTDPRYTAQYAKNDEPSRLAYCIGRVTQFCKRPEADSKIVIEDCSDPKFAEENAARCPLQPSRQATCTGADSTLLSSTSSIFEVKPQVLSLPEIFKAEQLGKPQLLESPDNPLQQYILIPKEADIATGYEVLSIDPRTGRVRMLGVDKGQLSVVKDANGVGTILMVAKSDGVVYLSNAWSTVEGYMKDAVSIDQAITTQGPTLLTGDATTWNRVQIPADELILTALPNDKGVVVFTGNANGTLRGIWYFASIADANGKFIPIPDASKYMVRKAFITPDNGKLATDLALKTTDESGTHLSVMHSDDILMENPTFTALLDPDSGTKALKKAISEDWVKNSGDKTSSNKNSKDKDQFGKSLSTAISVGTVGIPAVSYGFEDYGDESSAFVIQPHGLDLYKKENGVIAKATGEFLSAGTDGEVCRKTIAALAVDANNWGGKDVALISDNGSGTVSIAFYSNSNQPPLITSLTAESKADGIQLGETSANEEGETSRCKWQAFQKMPDGTLKDVSSQLDNPDSCTPIFKTASPAPQTSLVEQPSLLDVAADWLVAKISISTAYAEEPSAHTSTYFFRLTSIDPLGVTASAQETVQVTTQPPAPASGVQEVGADSSATMTDTTATPPTLKIVVGNMELLTPRKEISKAQTTSTTTPPATPLTTKTTTGESGHPTKDVPTTTQNIVDTKPATPAEGANGAAEGGWGCALIRHTTPTRAISHLSQVFAD